MMRSNRFVGLAIGLAIALAAAPVWAQKKKPAAAKPAGAKPAPAPPAPPPMTVDLPATRKDLFSEDGDRAAAAANKLGQSRQAGALDALLDALAMGLSPSVAVAALDAVAMHRDGKSLDVLLHYAKNRNVQLRGKAVAALGGLEDKKARTAWTAAFADGDKGVRAMACKVAETRKDRETVDQLLALLKKGDEATSTALAAVANADVARRVAELVGEAPDGLVAETLGKISLRTDLGKEDVYVEIVRAIGKIPGDEAVVALSAYIAAVGEKSFRQSKREAQMLYEQRIGGGQPEGGGQ